MTIEVSVVMATFKRPKTLVEALRSILDQRGVELEVLVVDDCPDGSAEAVVLGIGDPRVRYLRNPVPSQGRPARVRNLGWPLTQGEVIHFADDDDLVPEGLYADAMAEFRRLPHIGIVFGRSVAFGEPSDNLRNDQGLFDRSARRARRLQRLHSALAFTAHLLFLEVLFVGGSSLVRRRCVEALGGLPTDTRIMEDVAFLTRATRRFGASYLDRVSLEYRVWPSLMHSQTNLGEAFLQAYTKIQGDYRQEFGAFEFLALKIAARTMLRFL